MPINSLHSDTLDLLMQLAVDASSWMPRDSAYGVNYTGSRRVELYGDSELAFHGLATITDIEDTVTRDESRPSVLDVRINFCDTTPGSPPDGMEDSGFYALAVILEDPDDERVINFHYRTAENSDGERVAVMVHTAPPARPF